MHPDEYARLAEAEERLWYLRALRERVTQTCAAAQLPAGSAVLDAGCGTGGLLARLRAWRPDLALQGLDFSRLACGYARGRGFNVSEGSIEELPFSDATFHAIVCADVLSQIESPLLGLVEFFRCLKPDGRLVLNVAALPWLWSYHDVCVQSVQRFRASQLRGLMREAGFEVIFVTHWNFFLLPITILRRKIFPRRDGRSDVGVPPAPVNAALGAVAAFERMINRAGVPLPVGSSLFVVARKPARLPRVRLE